MKTVVVHCMQEKTKRVTLAEYQLSVRSQYFCFIFCKPHVSYPVPNFLHVNKASNFVAIKKFPNRGKKSSICIL
jgi:hypothetical protein